MAEAPKDKDKSADQETTASGPPGPSALDEKERRELEQLRTGREEMMHAAREIERLTRENDRLRRERDQAPPLGKAELEQLRADRERLTRENEDLLRKQELRDTFGGPHSQGSAPLGQRPGDRTIRQDQVEDDEPQVSLDQLATTVAALRIIRTYENSRTRVHFADALESAGLKFRQTDPNDPADVDTDSDGYQATQLVQSIPDAER